MSVQYGANNVDELLEIIKKIATDMQKFSDCINNTRSISIDLDEDDNTFIITKD